MAITNSHTSRLHFIDLMKGICIVLIVVGHVDTALFDAMGHNTDRVFETFRVPMYYFISGIFIKQYGGFLDFTRKKVNNIIIPLIFFYLFAYLVALVFSLLPLGKPVFGPFRYGFVLQPLLYRHWDCNEPLWFLLSLFQVNLIYYVLRQLCRRRWILNLLVLLLAGLGYFLSTQGIELTYFTETALVGLPFFVLGASLKQLGALSPMRHDRMGLWILVPVLVLVWFFAGDIDIYSQKLPPFVVFYGLSSIAIVALFWFCKNLPNGLVGLNYLGRYSLVVLGTHYVFIPIVRALLQGLTSLHGLSLSLATLILVLLLMYPTIALFVRVFPRFTAQRELFGFGWHFWPKE